MDESGSGAHLIFPFDMSSVDASGGDGSISREMSDRSSPACTDYFVLVTMSAMAIWTWKEGGVEHGVQIYEDRLHWWSAPPEPDKRWAGGGATDQTIEDFTRNGPHLRSCPLRIVRKLVAALEIEEADWWHRRLAGKR
jgi:hypothetical protein